MKTWEEGTLIWQPTPRMIDEANLSHYMRWLDANMGKRFDNYDDLWRWSVTEIEVFWASICRYFHIRFEQPPTDVLADRKMPGAVWFPGATLNYTENIFRQMSPERPMMLYKAEDQPIIEISWDDVHDQVSRLAAALRGMGVQRGDRVMSYMPNRPETIIALLACASIGAIWSSCSPDFGSRSVLDRFSQIEPKVMFAVDGYRYGGKTYDRREIMASLQNSLPTLETTILVPHLTDSVDGLSNTRLWGDVLNETDDVGEIDYEYVPFDHPLWILYSSGTTGLPKPIVHGHGGIVLEHTKATVFHNDLKPTDRFFWYTSTGWMMWNYVVGALFSAATIVLYDGSPGYPDFNALWQFAEESQLTYFGTSAAYVSACMKADLHPNQDYDLSRIRGVGSTGSPLTPKGFGWIYENINNHLALESLSGGTDLCTAFVGGARIKPIYTGEIQGASLGAKVQAYDETGNPVTNEVGELVITEPMPSMPVQFWNDPDMERYQSSYFEMYPGVWRHGDWIKFNERGGCVIYGRSDSTINRQGIRMGTSEIYQAVESIPEVLDSLIVDLELLGRESYLPLFVVLADDAPLNQLLIDTIKSRIRSDVSPRHVPDEIIQIEQVPYTLSGKKMEVPIRKILLGQDVNAAAKPGAMRNPDSIKFFEQFADRLNT